ncbi:hypothetical protein EV714DRAFT_232629 [Schizophyllum commune]
MEGEIDWCASCGRQLAAKRITETIRVPAPPNAQPPAPAPGKKGRKQPRQAPAQPATVLKTRTVYDSAPLPLYCSDKCRLADLQSPARAGALPIGHNPVRHPWRLDDDELALVPDCAVDDVSSVGTSSSASSTSSAPELQLRDMDPSLAAIFRGYDFKPMPLVPGLAPDARPAVPRSARRKRDLDAEYNGGIMMSGKRIQEWTHPEQPKPSRPAYPLPYPPGYAQPTAPTKSSPTSSQKNGVIPGWNDGTNAWRASIYNLSSTTDVDPMDLREHYAYSTQVASTHRSSGGVVPTIQSSPPTSPVTSTSSVPGLRRNSAPSTARTDPDALLLSKFSEPFSRRSESRQTLNSGSPRPSSSMPEYREKSLVARGAEHALLVPNVTLKVRRRSNERTGSSLPGARSPLSMTAVASSDEETDGDDDVTLTEDKLSELKVSDKPKRPTIESRPWSYDGYKTYPAMPLKREVSALWRW